MNKDSSTTDFGYRHVPSAEKAALVANIFNSVANRYDLMNDVMSFGLHRFWKRVIVQDAMCRPHHHVLDVASGTGDLALAFAPIIKDHGALFITDINNTMLSIARDRLTDAGLIERITYLVADAEVLPFANNQFDIITIAFGLRNVTNKKNALNSLYRVLKPGGKLLILEFSHPQSAVIQKIYDFYSFNIIPTLGEWIAKDKASYDYLVESIRMHPNQNTLKQMMCDAQFEDVTYHNFHQGIVALHKGYKY